MRQGNQIVLRVVTVAVDGEWSGMGWAVSGWHGASCCSRAEVGLDPAVCARSPVQCACLWLRVSDIDIQSVFSTWSSNTDIHHKKHYIRSVTSVQSPKHTTFNPIIAWYLFKSLIPTLVYKLWTSESITRIVPIIPLLGQSNQNKVQLLQSAKASDNVDA